jgi:hypothetical protein
VGDDVGEIAAVCMSHPGGRRLRFSQRLERPLTPRGLPGSVCGNTSPQHPMNRLLSTAVVAA